MKGERFMTERMKKIMIYKNVMKKNREIDNKKMKETKGWKQRKIERDGERKKERHKGAKKGEIGKSKREWVREREI